jgi:hypothetical protein
MTTKVVERRRRRKVCFMVLVSKGKGWEESQLKGEKSVFLWS